MSQDHQKYQKTTDEQGYPMGSGAKIIYKKHRI